MNNDYDCFVESEVYMRKRKRELLGVLLIVGILFAGVSGNRFNPTLDVNAKTKSISVKCGMEVPFYINHYAWEDEISGTFFVKGLTETHKKRKNGTYDITITMVGVKTFETSFNDGVSNLVVYLYKDGNDIDSQGGWKPTPYNIEVTHEFKFKSVKPGKYVYKVCQRTGYQ